MHRKSGTDGAWRRHPDPAGPKGEPQRREHGEYLGTGTNNIAELTAIPARTFADAAGSGVVIYTDSSYSIGILSQGWKAKANQELVAEIRTLLREFPQVRFVKVAGHAGIPEMNAATSWPGRRSCAAANPSDHADATWPK